MDTNKNTQRGIDRTGSRYGFLTVIGFSHSQFRSTRHGSYRFWKCRCYCGNETIVLANNLVKGNTTSCGCQSSRNTLKERVTKHGMTKTKTYNSWRAMKDRCYCKSHTEYKRYGAIGIKVCKRWKDSFENFLHDMGERPEKMSLERKNLNKDYSPSNCIWASSAQQANNKKNSKFVIFKKQKKTVAQWSREVGIRAATISARLKRGWSVQKSLTKGATHGNN